MTGYAADTAAARIAVGEVDTIFRPRTMRPNAFGVVLCHGAGNPSQYTDLTTQPSSVRLAAALASSGFPCITGVLGGNTWANDTGMARVAAARTALEGQFPAMRTDKFALLGVSMGALVAARYCQENPGDVAGMVGLIPLFDLLTFYAGNVTGAQAEIGTAWGVTAPAALPAAADVAGNAAAAADVPLLVGYSTADTFAPPAQAAAYTEAVGGTAVVTDTTTGHTDAAVGGMPTATVLRFLAGLERR